MTAILGSDRDVDSVFRRRMTLLYLVLQLTLLTNARFFYTSAIFLGVASFARLVSILEHFHDLILYIG